MSIIWNTGPAAERARHNLRLKKNKKIKKNLKVSSSWVGPPGKLQAASARARKSEKVSSGWARPKNFYIY